MKAFGPVPSRRLGRSLGVNNIPPKVCTYSCVYCQVGRTTRMQTGRHPFYAPEEIAGDVREKVESARQAQESIDYLTFVPDGEPTLDVNLGHEIELLRPLGVKIAVITNASLIWRQDVRQDLVKADWVSLKVDSTHQAAWRKINRPHRALHLASIVEGMLEFSQAYTGELVTETMLIDGINDSDEQVGEIARFLGQLKPSRAYLSIPTRPPAELWARPPDEGAIHRAYQALSSQVSEVELLIGYEGNAFASTGDVEEDLLSITAVHPMRETAVKALLKQAGSDWQTVDRLIGVGALIEIGYAGERFYMRRLSRKKRAHSTSALSESLRKGTI
jgi:wyosine [tRNA(Phe)-imidazoG37] synthetase (radical SAM superfamily)